MSSDAQQTRRQMSMFIPAHSAGPIEAIRRLVDPAQHHLIPAHVTLCRDEEIGSGDFTELRDHLAIETLKPMPLQFGAPDIFDGHGILMPCIAGEERFHALRERILGYGAHTTHRPHITLAHPRNPMVASNSLAATKSVARCLILPGSHRRKGTR